MEAFIAQAFSAAATEIARSVAQNPGPILDGLEELFGPHHHTGYDAIQDIWDAVEAGHISHSAALQATAILAADLEKRRQRPAAVPPGTARYESPLDFICQLTTP